MRDLDKRRRVMQRSMQLGHCVCDPKKPCPCDVLRERDVCPCAGERLDEPVGEVRLTELVDSPGCASKIDAATLRRVLQGLPSLDDPRVLVGAPAGDDAGVYRLDERTALVQTVDVFSPSVDDPYLFGQIAAANSLSDVYAMGGRPLTALSIVGFPVRTVGEEILREILRGGVDKMTEADVPVVGGHSINDPQIKAGFAVTGVVHPGRIVTNAAARPGDRLILTKPLGTGILAFAHQIGRAPAGAIDTAGRSMAQLNRRAAELMIEHGVTTATDVTGFGLAGHLGALAAASGVDVRIVLGDLPLLPGVRECIRENILPGAIERNRESSADRIDVEDAVDGEAARLVELLFDPQTSGGLVMCVAADRADELVARLRAEGYPDTAEIGQVIGPGPGRVVVQRHSSPLPLAGEGLGVRAVGATLRFDKNSPPTKETTMDCCSSGHPTGDGAPAGAADQIAGIQQRFHEFLKAANAPGALDMRTKQAIALALSVLAKCEPCVKIHLRKARDMGFSEAEIDEAAWMAIAFGGSPTMMFYNAAKRLSEKAQP